MGRRWRRILLFYIIMMGLFCITLAVSAQDLGMGLDGAAREGIAVVNTDFQHARIISVNSVINDVLEETGQQRWYAFTSDCGRLTLDVSFDEDKEVDYAMYLYQYDSKRGHIVMIDKMTSDENTEEFVCTIEQGIYFVAVNGAFACDAEHTYTLDVALSDDVKGQLGAGMKDAYFLTSFSFHITGSLDLNLMLLAFGFLLQKQEDCIARQYKS